ncbi:MAG: CPBP family intramembrane metalloprotease [Bacteroidia bacterium]|nr:CPBP family intramembrane metalloprotease [Bacteroidia bacterium]
MEKLRIVLPLALVIVYTGLILLASRYVKTNSVVTFSQNGYLNFQFNYQLLLLAVTLLSLLSTYFLNKQNFVSYFSFGTISAPAQEMKWFGIKANDSWTKTGISLSLVISLATALFMYFQLKQVQVNWLSLKGAAIWIILFSLSNSFGEEMIYRLGIISPLKGLFSPFYIYTISAILFGLPHLAGMPSGFIGATMAGVLGWVLAKSVFETNGFFWAWFIHFIQDVIIITGLFLISFKTE